MEAQVPDESQIISQMSSFVDEKKKRTRVGKENLKKMLDEGNHDDIAYSFGYDMGEQDAFNFLPRNIRPRGEWVDNDDIWWDPLTREEFKSAHKAWREGYKDAYDEVKFFTKEQKEDADKIVEQINAAITVANIPGVDDEVRTNLLGRATGFWQDILGETPIPDWGQVRGPQNLSMLLLQSRHQSLGTVATGMTPIDSTFGTTGTTSGTTATTRTSQEREFFHATVPFGANESQQLGESDVHFQARMQRLEERDDELFDVAGSERVRVDQRDAEEARDEYFEKLRDAGLA